ncbi:MAG: CAP domain-containing protein [Desulfobacterales bacterium]|nr:CAP domain-containing protein [Desulfobacterales bacterium]
MEKQLVELINQARRNPVMMAEMIDIDIKAEPAFSQERRAILNHGVRSLSVNRKLQNAAFSHVSDMLMRNYYAQTSRDGQRPEDRIRAEGYLPIASGESIGMVSFNNFMSEEQAVWEIFKNMLRDELSSRPAEPWHILGSQFSEIGVAVQSGSMNFEGTPVNVYIAACDFGASQEGSYAAERKLLQLINTVRANPDFMLWALGIDHDTAFKALGVNGWVLGEGLPPLSANEKLFDFAERRVDVDRKNRPEGTNLLFLTDVRQVLEEKYDYDAITAAELLVSGSPDKAGKSLDAWEGAFMAFLRMLQSGLNASGKGFEAIFNPDFTEIGIAYREPPPSGNNLAPEGVGGMLLCTLANPADAKRHIVGRVSRERAENPPESEARVEPSESYSPNGLLVAVYRDAARQDNGNIPYAAAFTDPTGGYCLRLPNWDNNTGPYRLSVSRMNPGTGVEPLYTEVFAFNENKNLFKNLRLQDKGE